MTDDQIADLLRRLRAGEPGARDELFEYVAERFRPLASKLLRQDFQRLGALAETNDVLHDSLCRLIPYLVKTPADSFNSKALFHSLAATTLRHTLINLARKHFGKWRTHELGEGLEAAHPLLQQSSGLEGWRERLRVHELIERLPESERVVLEMKVYLGLGSDEIAERLGVHPGTVSRRLASAKEMLGRLLREDDRETA